MKINDDVIKSLISLPFLKENRETTVPIKQIKKLQEAEKSINSLKWENFVLEKDGDFSVYLFKNQSDIYKHWNSLANSAKEEIIPEIEARLDNLIAEGKLVASMKDQIKFDIIGLAIYLTSKKRFFKLSQHFMMICMLYTKQATYPADMRVESIKSSSLDCYESQSVCEF